VAGRLARPRQVVFHLPSRAVTVAGFQMAEQVRLCLPAWWGGIRTVTALRIRLLPTTSCPALGREVGVFIAAADCRSGIAPWGSGPPTVPPG